MVQEGEATPQSPRGHDLTPFSFLDLHSWLLPLAVPLTPRYSTLPKHQSLKFDAKIDCPSSPLLSGTLNFIGHGLISCPVYSSAFEVFVGREYRQRRSTRAQLREGGQHIEVRQQKNIIVLEATSA
jgi:hypothetical protein